MTIDTNHVISGAISPGNYSSQLLLLWQEGTVHWIQTSQTFRELQEVLRRERFKVKYGFQEKEIEELLETIATGTEFVPAIPIFRLPLHGRDKKDDKFLACALGGDCDYLITEDEDLLVLNGKRELGETPDRDRLRVPEADKPRVSLPTWHIWEWATLRLRCFSLQQAYSVRLRILRRDLGIRS